MTPFRITTEAGKALWTKINNEHGSSVWGPVGDGIVAIEAEVTNNIIKQLKSKRCACLDMTTEQFFEAYPDPKEAWNHSNCFFVGIDWVIDLIKETK